LEVCPLPTPGQQRHFLSSTEAPPKSC
jgi:hypothetical protein